MFSWPRGRNARSWTSLLALLLGACGGSSDPSVPTEISLNTTTLAFTSVGGTQQLTATVVDQRGDPLPGAAVAWSSSNEIVATVSLTGLVTATGPGSTEITASSGEATTTADVSVTQVVATFEQVSGDGQAAVTGQTLPQPLVVRARDASGTAIPNLTVSFEAVQGGGNVTPEEAETGPDGTASAVLTVGPNPGQTQQVLATIAGTDFTTTFSATSTNPAAVVEVFAGNGQSAAAGANVPVAPAVRALDAADQPVAGVQVQFQVTTGGGSVSGALKATNAQGVATLDSWTLGPTGINTLSATVEGQTVSGEPLVFVATTDAASGYNIKIRYLGTPSASQLLAFAEAELKWESVVTGDLPDFLVEADSNDCFDGTPAFSETIDDLLIFAILQPIDGPGATVGLAGYCGLRPSAGLPIVGVMLFDTDDLEELESFELLDEVAVHEMGHVMGIGSLWGMQGLLADPDSTGGTDPHFTGPQAIAAFDAAGGASYTGAKVPVENDDELGPASVDAHWRETVLDNELLTSVLNFGPNPLSAITVRSLADQGYVVNVAAADPYSLAPALRAAGRGRTIALHNDILRLPIRRVDASGRLVQVPAR